MSGIQPISPELDAPLIRIAEGQPGFIPVTGALVLNRSYDAVETEDGKLNAVVLAFRPNEDERAKLAAGEDIYVTLLTFMEPMQGIIVSAGKDEPSAMFNVKATERREYFGHRTAPVDVAALFIGFMAWLSTRQESVTIGAGHDAAVLPPLIEAFLESQGISAKPIDEDWHTKLSPYPTEVPIGGGE